MLKGRRRWLLLGAAAAVLAVGAGAGIAATGGDGDGFLAGVAKRLGISEDKLEDAIRDEQLARIDRAVREGDLTEEQGERLKERVRSGDSLGPGFGLGRGFGLGVDPQRDRGFGLGPGFGRILEGAGDQLEAAADYLGLSRAELMDELSDGDSLAEIARERNKSVDGLETAMKNALKEDLDAAVDDGALTRSQADDLYEKLSAGIDHVVERGLRLPKGFGRGLGFGFGLGGGELLENAADYLGVTVRQLRQELSDGDSLAEVARQKSKSVDGLKTALRNGIKADLDQAVEDGVLDRERANDLQETLSEHVDELVENELRGFGFRLRLGGGRGFDFELRRPSNLPGIFPGIPLPEPEPAAEEERPSVF
jgi:hypothetical protein